MESSNVSKLLCDCLRIGPDNEQITGINHLSAADWARIFELSLRHGVAPLLYQRLFQAKASVPSTILQELQVIYFQNAARNTYLYHQLSTVLTTLQQRGIPVIVLKGAYLAEAVYQNIALRPMVDIDLLIKEEDLLRAVDTLSLMDYAPQTRTRTSAHLSPFSKSEGVQVELHWTLEDPASPFRIDVDGLWKRAQPILIADVNVWTLSPEDVLLYLCLHTAFRHRFEIGLLAFCDISETLGHYRDEIDWDQLQSRAQAWGIHKCLYLSLYFARELLAAAVPDEIWSAFETPDLDGDIESWVRGKIFLDKQDSHSMNPNLARVWGTPQFWDKAGIFLKSVFPSPKVIGASYALSPFSWKVLLYYPRRLKTLLLRYGYTIWRLLRHNETMMTTVERENLLIDWLTSD